MYSADGCGGDSSGAREEGEEDGDRLVLGSVGWDGDREGGGKLDRTALTFFRLSASAFAVVSASATTVTVAAVLVFVLVVVSAVADRGAALGAVLSVVAVIVPWSIIGV